MPQISALVVLRVQLVEIQILEEIS
jgi:hypothetical protein